mgnify:CR=1 FL=1
MNEEERDLLIDILRELSSEIALARPDSCAPWPAADKIAALEEMFQRRTPGTRDLSDEHETR